RRQLHLRAGSGSPQPGLGLSEPAPMPDRRADAIEPAPLVAGPGRSEGRTGELLGIKPIGAALWGVAADRERAGQRLGLEAVAKAGEIGEGAASRAERNI